jgi:hypothetical protein
MENPPVPADEQECMIASYSGIPPHMSSIASVKVSVIYIP